MNVPPTAGRERAARAGLFDVSILLWRDGFPQACNNPQHDPGADPSLADLASVTVREGLRSEKKHLRVRVTPGVRG